MKATMKIIMIALLVLACGIGGCQAKRDKVNYSNPVEDEFYAGMDRSPTAKTLYAMSRMLVARQRDAQAEFVLSRILDDYPNFIPAYNDLAELKMRQNNAGEAIDLLVEGIERDPNNPVLLNNLGICLMLDQKYEAAALQFDHAMQADGQSDRYQANKALALALSGQYDLAYEEYTKVMRKKDAHYNVAVVSEARGDLERAEQEYKLSGSPQ